MVEKVANGDYRPGIVLMVKVPRAGRAKTRLIPFLSSTEAAELAAGFVRDVVASVRLLTPAILVAFTPGEGRATLETLLGNDLEWTPQREVADLGERMQAAVEVAAAAGWKPIVILGTDSPTFPREAVENAFRLLMSGTDLVLGPADDGGYWCVGLRQPISGLFDNITWSTETVFEQTMANAERLRLAVATVTPWYDVDTADDLRRLEADPYLKERAPITASWLTNWAEHRRTTA